LSEAQVADLSAVASSCKSILEELNQTLDRYRVLERRQSDFTGKLKRVWKRVSLEPEDIRELRSRITSNVVMLEALNGRITRENTTKLVRAQDDTERNAILDWITPTEYASQHSDFIDRRQPGTGEWFLESPEYEKWVNRSERTLFSPGIPGSGKTILASIVVDDLLSRYQYDPNIAIAYIYLNFRQQDAQKVQHLLASLLKQLSRKRPLLPDSIKDMHAAHIIHGTRPSVAELSVALRSVVASFAAVYVVIDALDECRASDGCREDFLTELFGLQKTVGLQLFATSRWIPEITERFEGHVTLEIKASEQDVQRYVASTLPQLPRCVRDDPELQSEIQQGIVQAVDGMYVQSNRIRYVHHSPRSLGFSWLNYTLIR
jgi:Cdc6-like AAA superfamily ATPase